MESWSRGKGKICYSVRVIIRTLKSSKIEKNYCKLFMINALVIFGAT